VRALVTGAGGFVGHHLIRHLLKQGDEVTAVVRHAGERLAADIVAANVRLERADLVMPDAIGRVIAAVEPDHIYHLAALSSVAESFAEPLRVLDNNAATVVNLLDAVRQAAPAARVLLVSSAEVYGRPRNGSPIDEGAELQPESPYAVSKATQDLLGYQYWVAYGLHVIRVRPFNHIGPGQGDQFVASSFARQVAEIEAGIQRPEILVGNLSAKRDFTDVRDIVRAYRLAVEAGEDGAVYNLGSGRAVAIQEILDRLTALSRVPLEVATDPSRLRPVDAPLMVCNAGRFQNRTGWTPGIPLATTLQDLLDDWRAQVAVTRRS
jgi:GDP-4-dehydro-6-deoxy-D-mannose reductase